MCRERAVVAPLCEERTTAIWETSLGTKDWREIIEPAERCDFNRPSVWKPEERHECIRRLLRAASACDRSGVLARQLKFYSFRFEDLKR